MKIIQKNEHDINHYINNDNHFDNEVPKVIVLTL